MSKDGKKTIKLDKEQLQKLRSTAEAAGVEIPGLIQYQPTIDLDEPVSDIAQQLGGLCSRQPIFFRAGNLVAVDDRGELEPMSPERFGSWVEKFVTTSRYTKERGEHAATMSTDLAKKILAADCFKVQIRELKFFFPVRLPVLRPSGGVELLQEGYDDQTESWTLDGLAYDAEMDISTANMVIDRYFGEWPWADRQLLQSEWTLEKSRDAAVVMSGMLGVFCRPMFGPGVKRPMAVVSGNQPGTGKTTLCKMMMSPVYGMPPEMSLPPTEEKFERLLESTALGMEPFLFLDDVGRMIRSNALNKFITASKHGGTRLYTQQTFSIDNVTQVFVTGNDLPIEANVKRRVIWAELFLAGEVQDREFKFEITDSMLAKDEVRSELLAAMWAMVRHWAENREHLSSFGPRRTIKSFEMYCRVIGGMLAVNGWSDPYIEAPGISGGDSESREFKQLLIAAADSVVSEMQEFTVPNIVNLARELGILEYYVGTFSDGDLPKKDRIRWGKKLAEFRGRIYRRTDGKFFQFARRDGCGGSVYPCRIADKESDF
jgi:hypothetical protein